MMKWRRKLRDNRGETLVETLASIVIASLSVALLFSGISAAVNIDRRAQELDRLHYAALTAAETRSPYTPPDGGPADSDANAGTRDLEISNSDNMTFHYGLDVALYGGEGLYAFVYDDGTGGAGP